MDNSRKKTKWFQRHQNKNPQTSVITEGADGKDKPLSRCQIPRGFVFFFFFLDMIKCNDGALAQEKAPFQKALKMPILQFLSFPCKRVAQARSRKVMPTHCTKGLESLKGQEEAGTVGGTA